MGFGDFLNNIPIIGPALAPGKTVNQPFKPLTGPPASEQTLVKNADGTSYDPTTGQTYSYVPGVVGANGTASGGYYTGAATPNSAQQVGADFNRANGFFNQVPGYDQREQQAYNQEGNVAAYLNNLVQGSGPSVAGAQLAGGQDQAARQQLAQAAGASGGNAALMRMLAMGNTAGLQAATNQQQAMARVQEERDALAQLAGVTGNMQQQSMGMAGQKISAADALNGLAMQGQSGFEDRNLRAQLGNQASQDSRYKDALNGIQGLGSSAMTGGML